MRTAALLLGLGLFAAAPSWAQSSSSSSSSSSHKKKHKAKAKPAPAAEPPPPADVPAAPAPDLGGEESSTPTSGPVRPHDAAPEETAAPEEAAPAPRAAPAPAPQSDDLLGPPAGDTGKGGESNTSVSYTDFPNHKRIDPGLGIWILGDTRGYQGLDGAAAAAGLALGYSWDLASINLVAEQAVAVVGEKKPTYAKLDLHATFFTLGNFAGQLEAAVATMLNGPLVQTDINRGPMIGPEVGAGFRYRFAARVDLVVLGNADVLTPLSQLRHAYFNPGVMGGLAFYPFGGGG